MTRTDGIIVTAVLPDGTEVTRHRDGLSMVALAEIITRLDRTHPGWTVQSISTVRTILRDLQYPPRQRSARKRRSTATDPHSAPVMGVDPWAVERSLLAKLDRLDLLPQRMRRSPHTVRTHPLSMPRARRNGGA